MITTEEMIRQLRKDIQQGTSSGIVMMKMLDIIETQNAKIDVLKREVMCLMKPQQEQS